MQETNNNNYQVISLGQKEFLTLKEACAYLDISETWMYKLTHRNEIPYYKPNGKKIYFKREDLLSWISKKPVKSISELASEAHDYINNQAQHKKKPFIKRVKEMKNNHNS